MWNLYASFTLFNRQNFNISWFQFQLTLSNRIRWFLFGCDWLARRARARSRAWDTDAALFTACLASPAPSAHFGRLLRKILKRGQLLWVWKGDPQWQFLKRSYFTRNILIILRRVFIRNHNLGVIYTECSATSNYLNLSFVSNHFSDTATFSQA